MKIRDKRKILREHFDTINMRSSSSQRKKNGHTIRWIDFAHYKNVIHIPFHCLFVCCCCCCCFFHNQHLYFEHFGHILHVWELVKFCIFFRNEMKWNKKKL